LWAFSDEHYVRDDTLRVTMISLRESYDMIARGHIDISIANFPARSVFALSKVQVITQLIQRGEANHRLRKQSSCALHSSFAAGDHN